MNDFLNNHRKIVMLTASAGAGKTHSLAQTVIEVLEKASKVDLENILLITFTNKAVEEMEKTLFLMIRQKMKEDTLQSGRWQEILRKFNRHSIMTFDAFFASIIREFGIFHGVDPQFTIVDLLTRKKIRQSLEKLLRTELEKTIAEKKDWLMISSQDWLHAINAYGTVKSFLDNAFFLAENNERSSKHRNFIKEYFAQSPEGLWDFFQKNVLLPYVSTQLTFDIENLKQLSTPMRRNIQKTFSGKSEVSARNLIKQIYSIINDPNESGISLLNVFLNETFRKPTGKNADSDLIDLYVQIQEIRSKYVQTKNKPFYFAVLCNEQPENWNYWRKIIFNTAILADHINYLKLGSRQLTSNLEFDDVRSLCHQLIHTSSSWDQKITARLKSRYQYVFIDEFQDTAPSQMEIMTKIFGLGDHPLFLVGDEKQSIYRFRGAEVRLTGQMKKKLGALREDKYEHRELKYNFRSFEDLITCFNYEFLNVFSPGAEKPEYFSTYTDQLFPKAQISENIRMNFQPWEAAKLNHKLPHLAEPVHSYLHFINYEKSQNIVPSIVSAVREILDSTQAEHFNNDNMSYPLIGILLPTSHLFSSIEKAFDINNIPYTMYAKGFYQTSEIIALINLLRFWANPHDIYSVSALLNSELVGLSPDRIQTLLGKKESFSLSAINKTEPGLYTVLSDWLRWGKALPLKDALWKVIDYSPLKTGLNLDKHKNDKIANINKFIRELPDTSLHETINLMEIMIRDRTTEKEILIDKNPVSVMTIHKSKGLKFQHVITVTPTDNRGNRGSNWIQIEINNEEEVQNFYFTSAKFFPQNSAVKKQENIFNWICTLKDKEESVEEKKRLAYVSHTRAVQGLTLFNQYPTSKEQSQLVNRKSPINTVLWEVINKGLKNDIAIQKVKFRNRNFLKLSSIDKNKDIVSFSGMDANQKIRTYYHPAKPYRPDRIKIKINASQLIEWTNSTPDKSLVNAGVRSTGFQIDTASFGQQFHQFMENNIEAILNKEIHFDHASKKIMTHLSTFAEVLQSKFNQAIAFTEVGMESTFITKLNKVEWEVVVEGVADLLLFLPDQGYFLFDYKTGRKDVEKHKVQLAVYRDLLAQIYGLDIVDCALLYTSPDVDLPNIVYLNDDPEFNNFNLSLWIDTFLQDHFEEIIGSL